MTSDGGTKRSFSPFLMLLKATSPLSPTSTLSIPIFCGGSPDSVSHLCRVDAFSNESISQPQGTPTDEAWVPPAADTEQWIWCCFRCTLRWLWLWCSPTWLKRGTRVREEYNINLEASAMALHSTRNTTLQRYLICSTRTYKQTYAMRTSFIQWVLPRVPLPFLNYKLPTFKYLFLRDEYVHLGYEIYIGEA